MYIRQRIHTDFQLTDLSSLSSEEGSSPSHRKFSSTSYIMKKKHTTASKFVKQASSSSSSHSRKSEGRERGEDKKRRIKLPHESYQGEDRSTYSSLDTGAGGGRGVIPSIRVTSQEGETQATPPTTTCLSPNQSNGLNKESQSVNRQQTTPSHSQLRQQSNESSQLNGLNRQVHSGGERGSGSGVTGTHGHLFTEEEVQSLQRQIADLQVDLEQLLQYTHVS